MTTLSEPRTGARAAQPRLPGGDLLAVAFVLLAVGAGFAYGSRATGPFECGHQEVHAGFVALQNILLGVVLVSGFVTAGYGTLILGGGLLFYTGITIGVGYAHYGPRVLALLAPHGVLELSAWVLLASVGLLPLRLLTRPAVADARPLRLAARRGALAVALLLLAAPLESVWTVNYGPSVVC